MELRRKRSRDGTSHFHIFYYNAIRVGIETRIKSELISVSQNELPKASRRRRNFLFRATMVAVRSTMQ